ncbi:uncharacterized protein LOC117782326 [Drosophila innubila]|uniref:uncharacterized protein LOC117782326 n=1 Tax=Drosophila innubila TaxID=198719 RepID=UPI00148BDD37|nr:uncharacterized protein LOC117782326 [Drosophila innubila]
MNSTTSVICLLALVLSTTDVYGATHIGIFKSDDHPGKCVLDADTILDEGQVITRNCERVSCGSEGFVEFAGCGVKGVSKPCTLGEFKYPKADYPKCCINVLHCPDGDSLV